MNQKSDKSTKKEWRLPESVLLNFMNTKVQDEDLLREFVSKNFPSYSRDLLDEFILEACELQETFKKILEYFYSGKKLEKEMIMAIRSGLITAHPSILYVGNDYGRYMNDTGNITSGPYKHIDDHFLLGTIVFHRPETKLWYELRDILLSENILVICPNCGAFSKKTRRQKKYCSDNCRKAHHARTKSKSQITTVS